jgi:hypothetical protein
MAKYLVLWKADTSRTPNVPKEIGEQWSYLIGMVKQEIKEGFIKDWGFFADEDGAGYTILDCSKMEAMKHVHKYFPFIEWEIHSLASVDELQELTDFIKAR